MSVSRQKNIALKELSLKYTIWQGGDQALLCFHGFGQEHSVYKGIFESLKETHTVYSFDLFFHGKTEWHRKKESLLRGDWFEIMQLFLAEEQLDSFEVMGFSMGGKYAMVTAQLYPELVKHVHLISPDGIKTHFSYKITTYPFLLRRIFKSQIKKPWIFTGLVRLIRGLKVMNNYTLRFAESQMDTEFKRAQAYYSWVVLRHFMPQLPKLARQLNENHTPLTFYLGKYDKVINAPEVEPLRKLVPECQTQIIESGHGKMLDGVAKLFSSHH